MIVDMLLELFVLVHDMLLMVLVLVLLPKSWGSLPFSHGSTRSSSRVAPLRDGSKSVQKSFHLNRHLYHANPHDKLSASLTRATKYWISKYVLDNPLGSKTRSFLSSHV